MKRKKKANPNDEAEVEQPTHSKIDIFGTNPEWEPGWVKAYKINAAGQVLIIFGGYYADSQY